MVRGSRDTTDDSRHRPALVGRNRMDAARRADQRRSDRHANGGDHSPPNEGHPMRKTLLTAAALVALVGGGLGFAQLASADTTVTPTPSASPAVTPAAATPAARGYCIKNQTGDFKNLWLDPTTGKCPAPFWGPVSLGGGSGTVGPQGPKGDIGPKGDKGVAGDNVASVQKTDLVLNANSPATQTLVVKGLPAKTASVVELAINNATEAPSSATVHVTPLAIAAGSTERSFTVTASGFTGTQSFTLTVKVLAIAP